VTFNNRDRHARGDKPFSQNDPLLMPADALRTVKHNVDITVRGFRVRALHVRAIHQLLGGLSIYTGQTHIQTSLNVVVSV